MQGIVVVAAAVVGCIVAVGRGRFAVQRGLVVARVAVVAGNLKVVVAIADILVVADCSLQCVFMCVNSELVNRTFIKLHT